MSTVVYDPLGCSIGYIIIDNASGQFSYNKNIDVCKATISVNLDVAGVYGGLMMNLP